MENWDISEEEIEFVEKMLLPEKCHFADDAKTVIRSWKSTDVCACPGSGKTTILLAKLKIIADRMPLENEAGICVLSHTNVAVNEIKSKMTEYSDKLMNYPNFVGTIQSFIDKFITFPYLKSITNQPIHIVENSEYTEQLCKFLLKNRAKYSKLYYFIDMRFKQSGSQYGNIVEYTKGLYLKDGILYHTSQYKALATAGTNSATLYKQAKEELLISNGLLTYNDAYQYGLQALNEIENLRLLLSKRFRHVFIDEYQDCSQIQRDVLSRAFDNTLCSVYRIGDPDQAIYSSDKENPDDWIPSEDALQIASSNRYSQEIANILSPLRTGKLHINSLRGESNIIPTVIIYDDHTKNSVIDVFASLLTKYGLTDPNGTYKAIGWIRSESAAGLKIGDYWDKYNASGNKQSANRYWEFIEIICEELEQGKLYKAENIIRQLMCKVVNLLGCKDLNGRSFTYSSIKKKLDNEYFDIYHEKVIELVGLAKYTLTEVDKLIRQMINKILENDKTIDVFPLLPQYFKEDVSSPKSKVSSNNIYAINGIQIQFSTVHKVKGETHDATLYLETETCRSSDLKRVLPFYTGKKPGTSPLHNYSRKCVYVGFSRPRKLLCVAMHEKTYNQSGNAFQSWVIYDCRKQI